jgi:putative DNA primase/helicase
VNIREIKSSVDIVEVVGRYVQLKRKGAEEVGICPFHDDHKASLNVNPKKQLYFCGACGAAGDVFDFLVKGYGRTLQEAADELRGISTAARAGDPEKRKAKVSERVSWRQIKPAPNAPGQITHYRHGRPARIWEYRLADGSLAGLICRFETRDGKEILPYTYCQDDQGRKDWRWQGFEAPRPLYGLADITQRKTETVLIVEGEKAADAAQTLLPHIVVTCWQGGAKAIEKTDFTPLHGRKIVLWPDNDLPGWEAMKAIATKLAPHCKTIKWIPSPMTLAKGWDVADAIWTPDETLEYVRANMADVPETLPDFARPAEQVTEQPPADEQITEIPPAETEVPQKFSDEYENYFRFLGYEKDGDAELIGFYVKEARIVHKYRSGSLSALSNLCNLAPLDFWQQTFPKRSGDKVDTVAALNWIIRASRQAGVFSPRKLRGRGAWLDDGRVVVHAGEKLVIDGKTVPLSKFKTRYIYEAGEDMAIGQGKPIPVNDAHKLLEICQLVNWERGISAHLLAGWCVVAPICGALPWRPHIWITGPASSGKTWVFHHIVRRMLGRVGVMVQGETSEAGIRQTLGVDALPVVFDEAEGEDRRASDRVQSILGLMRAASAEDGGFIAKGSASGGVKNYRIRSCFAFASIAISLKQQSDRTRVTVLAIQRNHNEADRNDRWERLQRLHVETLTDDYCEAMQARTLAMVPVILDNAKTFAVAAAAVLQDQRAGDQLGPLLAGAFSLSSNTRISYEKALEWVESREWTEERALDEGRDERRLLSFLLDYITRVESNGTPVERSIGELVQIAAGNQLDGLVSPDNAQNRLKRLGMKADNNCLYISNNSNQVAKMLQNTPWAANHNRILERLEGAIRTESERFAGHLAASRAVAIPFSTFTQIDPASLPPGIVAMDEPKTIVQQGEMFENGQPYEDVPF